MVSSGNVGYVRAVSLTPDEFQSLADADKLTVLYSSIQHLRRNVQAGSEASRTLIERQSENHQLLRDRVTRIEERVSVLWLVLGCVLAVAVAALAKAAGIG